MKLEDEIKETLLMGYDVRFMSHGKHAIVEVRDVSRPLVGTRLSEIAPKIRSFRKIIGYGDWNFLSSMIRAMACELGEGRALDE